MRTDQRLSLIQITSEDKLYVYQSVWLVGLLVGCLVVGLFIIAIHGW